MSRKQRERRRAAEAQAVATRKREAWGDYVDPMDYTHDEPFAWTMSGTGGPWLGLNSREHGRDLPFIYTEQDLLSARQLARWMTGTTIQGIAILENLENWIIGKGFAYTAAAKRGIDAPAGLVPAVQLAIDDFCDYNDFIGDLDRELLRRDVRDGESFLGLFDEGGGQIAARVIEPEQVKEPTGSVRDIEAAYDLDDLACDWTLGINTPATDIQKVLGFHVVWNPAGTDWSYLTADLVTHSKRNTDRNVKRGMSDFFAVNNKIKNADKLLDNTAVSAAVQAAIPFIREHVAGTTTQQVTDFQANQTKQVKYPPVNASGTSRARNINQYMPGSVLDISRGMKYSEPPFSGEAGRVFLEVVQGCLRVIGSRWSMPEYMISGDASNANFASTMVAESPFVKKCEFEQSALAKRHRKTLLKMLAMKFAAGCFRKFGLATFDELRACIEIEIKPPRVASRDALKAQQGNQILHQEGILSAESWSADEGLDHDQEQEKLDQERQRNGTTGTPVELPAPTPGVGQP